jgi:hypothetical protein
MRIYFLLFFAFILVSPRPAVALTAGDIYEKHKNEIKQRIFSNIDGHLFIVVRTKNKTTVRRNRLAFRIMKLKAMKSILPLFAKYKFPDTNTNWFDLYFSKAVVSNITIRGSFVIDQELTESRPYLVLTVPEKNVESYIPSVASIKKQVNRAFDKGRPLNLIRYSRVTKGDRLNLVKKKIRIIYKNSQLKKSRSTIKENNISKNLVKDKIKPEKAIEKKRSLGHGLNKNITNNLSKEKNTKKVSNNIDNLNKTVEKVFSKDELEEILDCVPPLCQPIISKDELEEILDCNTPRCIKMDKDNPIFNNIDNSIRRSGSDLNFIEKKDTKRFNTKDYQNLNSKEKVTIEQPEKPLDCNTPACGQMDEEMPSLEDIEKMIRQK